MKVVPLLLVIAALAFSSPLQARGSKAYKASPAASAESATTLPTAMDSGLGSNRVDRLWPANSRRARHPQIASLSRF